MHHIHFDQIESTQNYLKDNFESLSIEHKDILVSAQHQTKGIGRRGNSWKALSNSLLLSFNLNANEVLTLTSLEMGVLIVKFIEEKFNTTLRLKWPNDILTKEGSKCGGVICHGIRDKQIIVGIGLNLGAHNKSEQPEETTKFPISYINKNILLNQNENKDLVERFYQYILDNRQKAKQVITNWNSMNYHHGKLVKITDGQTIQQGEFHSIDDIGALNLKLVNGEIKKIYNGSLWEV